MVGGAHRWSVDQAPGQRPVADSAGHITLPQRRQRPNRGDSRRSAPSLGPVGAGPILAGHLHARDLRGSAGTGFDDGDFVIVQERKTASNGEMVIAMLDDSAATVKKLYRERDGRIRLQPANETMAPIYVHENDITIQGIVVGVLRRY